MVNDYETNIKKTTSHQKTKKRENGKKNIRINDITSEKKKEIRKKRQKSRRRRNEYEEKRHRMKNDKLRQKR